MKIGELAAATGTTTKTLRFYDTSGLLPAPGRTGNGYRDYGPDALDRLDFIRRGKAAGLALAQIKQIIDLRDAGHPPCSHVAHLLHTRLEDLDRQIADLTQLRTTVADLHAAAAASQPASCPANTICHYL